MQSFLGECHGIHGIQVFTLIIFTGQASATFLAIGIMDSSIFKTEVSLFIAAFNSEALPSFLDMRHTSGIIS